MGATRVAEAARDGHGGVNDGDDGWLWRRRGCPWQRWSRPVQVDVEETAAMPVEAAAEVERD